MPTGPSSPDRPVVQSLRPIVLKVARRAIVVGVVAAALVLATVLPTDPDLPIHQIWGDPEAVPRRTLWTAVAAGVVVLAALAVVTMAGLGVTIKWWRPAAAGAEEWGDLADGTRRGLLMIRWASVAAFIVGLVGMALPTDNAPFVLPPVPVPIVKTSLTDLAGRRTPLARAAACVACLGSTAVAMAARRAHRALRAADAPVREAAFAVVLTAAPVPAGSAADTDAAPVPAAPPPAVAASTDVAEWSAADDPLRPWRRLVAAVVLLTIVGTATDALETCGSLRDMASPAAWSDLVKTLSEVPDAPTPRSFSFVSTANGPSKPTVHPEPVTGYVAAVAVAGHLALGAAKLLLLAWAVAFLVAGPVLRRTAVAVAAVGCVAWVGAAAGGTWLAYRFGPDHLWNFITLFVLGPPKGWAASINWLTSRSPADWAWAAAVPAATLLLLAPWPGREVFASRE